MSPLMAFHLFPILPSELRIKVYDLVLSSPRTIVISCQREKIKGTRQFIEEFVSKTAVPALLHTTRESRIEGLRIYTPAFKTDTSPNYTYISFEKDTVECVDRVLQYLKPNEIERVQKMLVHVHDAALFWHFHMEITMQMRKLKELDILTSQEKVSWGSDRTWVDGLINDIQLTKEKYPHWVCPRVKVLDIRSGEELSVIPSGVWVDPVADVEA